MRILQSETAHWQPGKMKANVKSKPGRDINWGWESKWNWHPIWTTRNSMNYYFHQISAPNGWVKENLRSDLKLVVEYVYIKEPTKSQNRRISFN